MKKKFKPGDIVERKIPGIDGTHKVSMVDKVRPAVTTSGDYLEFVGEQIGGFPKDYRKLSYKDVKFNLK